MYAAVVLSQGWKVHKSVLLHISPAQWALKKNKETREGKGSAQQPNTAQQLQVRPGERDRGP